MVALKWWQLLIVVAVAAGVLYLGHRFTDLAAFLLPAGGFLLLLAKNGGGGTAPPAPPAPGALLALIAVAAMLGLSACSMVCPDGDPSCVAAQPAAPSAKLCTQNPGGLNPGHVETCDELSSAFSGVPCYMCWDGPALVHTVLGEPGDDPCFVATADLGITTETSTIIECVSSCSHDPNIHGSCGSIPHIHN